MVTKKKSYYTVRVGKIFHYFFPSLVFLFRTDFKQYNNYSKMDVRQSTEICILVPILHSEYRSGIFWRDWREDTDISPPPPPQVLPRCQRKSEKQIRHVVFVPLLFDFCIESPLDYCDAHYSVHRVKCKHTVAHTLYTVLPFPSADAQEEPNNDNLVLLLRRLTFALASSSLASREYWIIYRGTCFLAVV